MQISHIIWSKFRVKKTKNKKKGDEEFVMNHCTIDIRSLDQTKREKISLFAQEVAGNGRVSESCRNYYIGDIKILALTSFCLEGRGTINTGKSLVPVAFFAEF